MNVALLLRSETEANLVEKEDDSLTSIQVTLGMRNELNRRFPITDILLTSALLDPRFVNLKCIDAVLPQKSISKVDFLVQAIITELGKPDTDHQFSQLNTLVSGNATCFLELAEKHSNLVETSDMIVLQECQAYFATAQAKHVTNDDILLFWKERRQQYPWLSALVKKTLCVPETSTPSECIFNVAGLTVASRRAQIHPSNVDKTIFIHDNYEICKSGMI